MKMVACLLFVLCGVLVYPLAFERESGFLALNKLNQQIQIQQARNTASEQRNRALQRRVQALRDGDEGIETHARYDLGMLKANEVYYPFAPDQADAQKQSF